jgi:hypothetical protein
VEEAREAHLRWWQTNVLRAESLSEGQVMDILKLWFAEKTRTECWVFYREALAVRVTYGKDLGSPLITGKLIELGLYNPEINAACTPQS